MYISINEIRQFSETLKLTSFMIKQIYLAQNYSRFVLFLNKHFQGQSSVILDITVTDSRAPAPPTGASTCIIYKSLSIVPFSKRFVSTSFSSCTVSSSPETPVCWFGCGRLKKLIKK